MTQPEGSTRRDEEQIALDGFKNQLLRSARKEHEVSLKEEDFRHTAPISLYGKPLHPEEIVLLYSQRSPILYSFDQEPSPFLAATETFDDFFRKHLLLDLSVIDLVIALIAADFRNFLPAVEQPLLNPELFVDCLDLETEMTLHLLQAASLPEGDYNKKILGLLTNQRLSASNSLRKFVTLFLERSSELHDFWSVETILTRVNTVQPSDAGLVLVDDDGSILAIISDHQTAKELFKELITNPEFTPFLIFLVYSYILSVRNKYIQNVTAIFDFVASDKKNEIFDEMETDNLAIVNHIFSLIQAEIKLGGPFFLSRTIRYQPGTQVADVEQAHRANNMSNNQPYITAKVSYDPEVNLVLFMLDERIPVWARINAETGKLEFSQTHFKDPDEKNDFFNFFYSHALFFFFHSMPFYNSNLSVMDYQQQKLEIEKWQNILLKTQDLSSVLKLINQLQPIRSFFVGNMVEAEGRYQFSISNHRFSIHLETPPPNTHPELQ